MNTTIKYIFLFFALTLCFPLLAQDFCYYPLKKQGIAALERSDFRESIKSFQSILKNCNQLSQSQREEILTLLNEAFRESTSALKEAVKIAQIKEREAKEKARIAIEKEKEANASLEKEKIAFTKSRASKVAFHAIAEENTEDELTLAYYSKKWLEEIDTIDQTSEMAFGEATLSSYGIHHTSEQLYTNAVTFVNDRFLYIATKGEVTIYNLEKKINYTFPSYNDDSTYPSEEVTRYNLEKKVKHSFSIHDDHITSLFAKKNGVISTSLDKSVKFISPKGEIIWTQNHHQGAVKKVYQPKDKNWLLSYCRKGGMILSNDQGKPINFLNGHGANIHEILFDYNSATIFTRSQNKIVGVWNEKGYLLRKMPHNSYIYDIDFMEHNNQLISATADGRLNFWNVEEGTIVQQITNHQGPVLEIVISNNYILTKGTDNKAMLYNSQGQMVRVFSFQHPVNFINFISGESQVVIGSGRHVAIYDFKGQLIQKLTDTGLNSVALSSDGKHILIGQKDKTAILFNKNGRALMRIKLKTAIKEVLFAASNNFFAIVCKNGSVISSPVPNYVYDQLKDNPPPLTKELKKKYNIQ